MIESSPRNNWLQRYKDKGGNGEVSISVHSRSIVCIHFRRLWWSKVKGPTALTHSTASENRRPGSMDERRCLQDPWGASDLSNSRSTSSESRATLWDPRSFYFHDRRVNGSCIHSFLKLLQCRSPAESLGECGLRTLKKLKRPETPDSRNFYSNLWSCGGSITNSKLYRLLIVGRSFHPK